MRFKRILAIASAIALMSPNLTVFAAGVGEVSSFEFNYMPYYGFTTTYVGAKPEGAPSKRLVRIDWSTDRGDPMIQGGNFRYDGDGHIVSTGGTTTYTYDRDGHVIRCENPYSWCDMEWQDGKLIRETYSNAKGQYGFSTFTYSDGKISNQHSEWFVNGGSTSDSAFLYDANGNLIQQGNDRYYAYDAEGRLISMHIDRGDSIPLEFVFTYDSDGYLSRITQLHYDDIYSAFQDLQYETIG